MVGSIPVLMDKWVDGKESSLWAGQKLHGLRQCVLGEPFEWNSFSVKYSNMDPQMELESDSGY